MLDAFHDLINNSAFWLFMGTLVSAVFAYRTAWIPYRNRNKPVNVAKASSFEELKAAVEILGDVIERQDKAHMGEVNRLYKRIGKLEENEDRLTLKVDTLQRKLREALNGNSH